MTPKSAAAEVSLLLLLSSVASAAAPDTPPLAQASVIAQGPALDGDILDDPVWQSVVPLTDFWQTTPDEGHPASEATEVRIAMTADTLYLGVVCRDREPDRVVANESRRDASLDDTDSFQVIFDTFRDRQNGFVFGTNPNGLEYDGQVVNEGEGGGFGGSELGGFNLNWDASWEVQARTGPFGWSAEFAIPLRTLRYAAGNPQTWGLNFQRNIRRRNERAYWAPLARNHTLSRLSSAGAFGGLLLPKQRNLQLSPYALGEVSEDVFGGRGRDERGDLGGEVKWSVTPSLTLDATVNTDFAQVEADEQQINLDRFDLFYAEKRPFFLENAGFFTVGTPGEVDLFFSRRIGLGPDGERIPILAGARLSGKAGRTNLGLLDMQTRSVDGITSANNFAVARVFREMKNRSGLGVIFANRQATGAEALPDDWNRTLALDGRWGVGRYLDLAGYAARTFTPGASEAQGAGHASVTWNSPSWFVFSKYTEVGEGFDPQIGFLARQGYRKPEALVFYTHRFLSGALLESRPHVSYRGFWKPDGFQESGFLHLDNHLEWRGGWELHTGVNVTREGLRQPFEIYPGIVVPPGTYDNAEFQLVGITNQGAPLSLELQLTTGGFFDGSRVSVETALRARAGDALNAYSRLEPQRREPRRRPLRHQPRASSPFLVAHPPLLRASPPAVQRPDRQLVHQPPAGLHPDGQQRPLPGLQREPRDGDGPAHSRSQHHLEDQPPVRPARLKGAGLRYSYRRASMGSRRGRAQRGVDAEHEPDGRGDADREQDRQRGHDRVPARVGGHALGDRHPQERCPRRPHRGDGEALEHELVADVLPARAHRAPDADLARPLQDGGEHDVHDADAAHEQRDAGDRPHHHVEQALGASALLQERLGHHQGRNRRPRRAGGRGGPS